MTVVKKLAAALEEVEGATKSFGGVDDAASLRLVGGMVEEWRPQVDKLRAKAEEQDEDKRTYGPKAAAAALALCDRFEAVATWLTATAAAVEPTLRQQEEEARARQAAEAAAAAAAATAAAAESARAAAAAAAERLAEDQARAAAEASTRAAAAEAEAERQRQLEEFRRARAAAAGQAPQVDADAKAAAMEEEEEEAATRWVTDPMGSQVTELTIEYAMQLAEASDAKADALREAVAELRAGTGGGGEYRTAMSTLIMFARNVLRDPTERSTRVVNASNPRFHAEVGRFPGGLAAMAALGFESEPGEGGVPLLVMNEVWLDDLGMAKSILEANSR